MLLIEDLNAKIGEKENEIEKCVGLHGLGERNLQNEMFRYRRLVKAKREFWT